MVVDEADFRSRCRDMAAAFGGGDRVHYASKAFLTTAIVRWVDEEGLCLDVASLGELTVALAAGFPPSRIAAHAADIVKGVPGAAEWDREMAQARKILDWETQMRLAIDPPVARAKRAQREAADTDACSMCGNYCAVKIVGQYMNKGE